MTENREQTGVDLIAAERQRQIEVKGWTADHDDEHDENELVWAAIAYAAPEFVVRVSFEHGVPVTSDPWPDLFDDKRERNQFFNLLYGNALCEDAYIRRLVKAGALIAAEIDRLQRLVAAGEQSSEGG